MALVEYKNIRTQDGISLPGYILAGNKYPASDFTRIGWVPDYQKYWIPEGLKRLSKEDFVKRQIEKLDANSATGEYITYKNEEADKEYEAALKKYYEENKAEDNEFVDPNVPPPDLITEATIEPSEWWSMVYDRLVDMYSLKYASQEYKRVE